MSQTERPRTRRSIQWSAVRIVLFMFDFVAVLLALEVAYIARYKLGLNVVGDVSVLDPLVPLLCLVLTLITYRLLDMYSMQLVGSGLDEYRAIALNTTLAFAAIVIVGYIDEGLRISRAFMLLFWLATIVLVGIARFSARRVV